MLVVLPSIIVNVKKIFLFTILFATLSCLKSYSLPFGDIDFDTSLEPTLFDVVTENKVSRIDERIATANADKTGGTFIEAPIVEDSEPTRSEIKDYDPATKSTSPKFHLFETITNASKDVYKLQVEQIDTPRPLLKDYLTFYPKKGPLEKLHIWSAYQMNFSETMPERGDSDSKYNLGLINILIDGTFNGGKETFRVMLDPTHRSNHPNFMQPFFQDLYIETSRIPHTKVLVGNSRPGVGVEGAQSPYTLDYLNRSQIARNLANIRKFGVRVRGDYSLIDYDTGVYSSSTNFTDFFPGHEFDGWVNFKPLGKTDGKYGKLVTGSGIQSGQKHGTSYYLTGAYIGYDYKKFKTKFEYARANGSNGGSGLTNNHSQGLFWTSAYRLTQKLEILARYDQFDSDRSIKNNNQREYTLGTNYYVKGQALRFIFNYIYCQRDNSVDSHRLMMGTQIIL